jgi:hypothetical protein
MPSISTAPLGVFLANHNADTGMKYWDLARWKQEIDAIRRMGANTVWFLPIQFGQKTPEDFAPDSPHWSLQIAIARAIADAGLRVGVYQGLNDVFPETLAARPEWAAEGGKYFLEEAHACPSIPEAWTGIMSLRERFFRELPQIDFLITPATDYGGCSCPHCAPWPATYLERFREQAALCRRFHSGVSIVAAGHGITPDDEDQLRELLRSAEWVDFVADIPRGCGKPVIKYYMSPEITMLGGWGKQGPCPSLKTIARRYSSDRAGIGGWVPYSEGVHDDINRFACLRQALRPTSTARDTAMAYTREWLGLDGPAAESVADALLGLGCIERTDRIYVGPDEPASVSDSGADTRVQTLFEARTAEPALAENYRYWLLYYRALVEAFCVPEGPIDLSWLETEVRQCREALARTEPSYARHLASIHPSYLPGVTAWCWPRSFRHYWNRERAIGRAAANH